MRASEHDIENHRVSEAVDDLADAADEVVGALLDENGLAPTDAALTVLDTSEVWVLDFSAVEADTGDEVVGWQSVHSTKESAVKGMFAQFDELLVDYDSPDVQVTASAEADNGSEWKHFTAPTYGWERISYSVHRMPVEA